MKKLLSIVLSVVLVASLLVTYTSAVRLNDNVKGFVALQVIENECELIDNSETNHLAFNKPVELLGTHGIGTTSTGDIVKFSKVNIEKQATQIFIKGGYNLGEGYEGTAAKFSVYLNKVEGTPAGSIEIFQEETSSSRITSQIYKYTDANIAPGTYDVYVVLESEYSGSFSEVGFLYEGGEVDPEWKTNPAAVKVSGDKIEEAAPRIPYTYTGENIYYISDNGDDMNDGLTPETAIKTMTKATLLFGEMTDVTLVIVDVHTYQRPIVGCKLVGADSYAKLQTNDGYRMDIAGDVIIDNLIIHTKADWADLMARGHRLEIGSNVKSTKDTSVTPRFMGIRGGDDKARIDGPTEVVVKGGEWETLLLGGRDASTEGNVHLTLYDTAKCGGIIIGNGVNSEEKPVNGSSTVKLMGKTVNVARNLRNPVDVMGNIYLDLTEFEGEKVAPAQWADIENLIVLTNPDLIPEDALPASVVEAMEEAEGEGEGEGTTDDEMTEEEKKQEEEDAKAAEEAAKKAEEERLAAEEAAKKAAEEEAAKKAAEEEAKKKAEEALKAEEEAKKALEEAKSEEEKKAAEEALKKAEEEKAAAEEAAKKAEEEAKAAEEAAKKAEEEKKAAEEAAKKAEEEKKSDETKTDENKTDDERVDNTADEKGGISPIIWVVIAVVVIAVIAVVIVASKKKKA